MPRTPRPGQGRLNSKRNGPVLKFVRVDDGWLPECAECARKLQEPFLIEAAASVGIEHNMDSGRVLRGLLTSYHRNGHVSM